MKYFSVVDCGTTNSRLYVLDQDLQMVAAGSKKVGVKDTTRFGVEYLKKGLSELFYETVYAAQLETTDINLLVAFGMITSELGLMEIPHLWAPAGLDDLVANVKVVQDPNVFPPGVPVVFVRGIKNKYGPDTGLEGLRGLDFLRGEETQIMGLLHDNPDLKPPFTVTVFSSHTKYVRVLEGGIIAGSMTTLSGQVYESIIINSAVAKSVIGAGKLEFDPKIADLAYEAVHSAGFLRTILMPRFMDVLLNRTPSENRQFLTASIVAEDMRSMNDFPAVGFGKCNDHVLLGQEERCECFEYFLKTHYGGRVVKKIYEQSELDRLNIQGAGLIARRAHI